MSFLGEDREQFAERVRARAARCGIELTVDAARKLTVHVARVLESNPELHLTSIADAHEFLERHLGESFEGAAELAPEIEGAFLDLGSGNGYPGIPIAVARPALTPFLAEASRKKAEFLRQVLAESSGSGTIVERQIQRGTDIADLPRLTLLSARALGNWERVLPRLAERFEADGLLLVWAGAAMESVARRTVWRRYQLVSRRPLPGRESSWIWKFRKA